MTSAATRTPARPNIDEGLELLQGGSTVERRSKTFTLEKQGTGWVFDAEWIRAIPAARRAVPRGNDTQFLQGSRSSCA